jgi:geranylgeranyl diphosphate synthase type II
MQTIGLPHDEYNFASYAKVRRDLIEAKLAEYLNKSDPDSLWESMRYSVLSGGKKLRALLCLASAESIIGIDKDLEPFLPVACAIEMVHAMSLIHDDLPALDNDDYRRGKLTNHKVYGEATALLAGDALLMLAIETIIEKTPKNIDKQILLNVISRFSQAIGAPGMVGGQILDLAFTGKLDDLRNSKEKTYDVEAKTIEAIHKGKTGALIKFSVWSGATLAGANNKQLQLLEEFADKLGFAFQIADDLLDVTGNLASIGKTPGKDAAASKVTWVTVFGEKIARQKLQKLEEEGLSVLNNDSLKNNQTAPLTELLKYAIYRTN